MKRMIGVLITLLMFACDTGVKLNLEAALKHTAEVLKLESTLLGEKEEVLVNLTWTWIPPFKPVGGSVVIERSIGNENNYTIIATIDPIEDEMYYNDNDSTLSSNSIIYYRLSHLDNGETDEFISADVEVPSSQHFLKPDSDALDLSNDTLEIIFSKLQEFDDASIALYKTSFAPAEIDSFLNMPFEELLNILTNPVIDTTITDTILIIPNADSLIEDFTIYVVKISSSKILEFITDSSIGLRPFSKLP